MQEKERVVGSHGEKPQTMETLRCHSPQHHENPHTNDEAFDHEEDDLPVVL